MVAEIENFVQITKIFKKHISPGTHVATTETTIDETMIIETTEKGQRARLKDVKKTYKEFLMMMTKKIRIVAHSELQKAIASFLTERCAICRLKFSIHLALKNSIASCLKLK